MATVSPTRLSSPAALWSERRFSSIFPNKCSLFHKCCMIGWQIPKKILDLFLAVLYNIFIYSQNQAPYSGADTASVKPKE